MRLSGKTGIITGASSGIGEAAARLFIAEGANIVLCARREDKLAELSHELGPGVRYVAGSVADEVTHAKLVETCVQAFGGLDFAFNNAGIVGPGCSIPDTTVHDWSAVLETNLTSAFYAAKHQVPAMQKNKSGGAMVFTSSFVGFETGLPGMGAYAASKAGLVGLVRVLAADHGVDGIRANALLPGGTLTEMAGDDPAFHEFAANLHILKRLARADEIAKAALFLCSDESSFVTGSAMLVDGGNSVSKV